MSAETGKGIPELEEELIRAAKRIPGAQRQRIFRLPIDRSFSAKGFGTVVTGTLISGEVRREQEVQLYLPERKLRVRGVQNFGKTVERAEAGQRTAVNLLGIEPGEITRGMVLSEPDRFQAVSTVDCLIELIPSAKPLKHRAPVHFHAGTAEGEARVRLFQKQAAIQPGTKSFARLKMQTPILLLPGDRFILRAFSPVTTIGGGEIIDTGGMRYRKTDNIAERLGILQKGEPAARVALLVRESKAGLNVQTLVMRTGLGEAVTEVAPYCAMVARRRLAGGSRMAAKCAATHGGKHTSLSCEAAVAAGHAEAIASRACACAGGIAAIYAGRGGGRRRGSLANSPGFAERR